MIFLQNFTEFCFIGNGVGGKDEIIRSFYAQIETTLIKAVFFIKGNSLHSLRIVFCKLIRFFHIEYDFSAFGDLFQFMDNPTSIA